MHDIYINDKKNEENKENKIIIKKAKKSKSIILKNISIEIANLIIDFMNFENNINIENNNIKKLFN